MSDTITPEKLRVMSADWSLGPGELRNALDDAADRIEALEAVRIALNKVIDAMRENRDELEATNAKLEDRIEALQQQVVNRDEMLVSVNKFRRHLEITNAKLLAALEEVRKWIGDGEHSDGAGLPRTAWTPEYAAVIDLVVTAIAAAKGESK